MWSVRAAFEFRVILNTDMEWSVSNFNGLNKSSIRRSTADCQTGKSDLFSIVIVKFIAVSMTFADCVNTVAAMHSCSCLDVTWISAKP